MRDRLEQVLDEARSATCDPHLLVARRWREAAEGRFAVGSFSPYFPAELCEALGILHVGLGDAPPLPGIGAVRGLEPTCSSIERTVGWALHGELEFLDAVVVGTICEPARNLGALLSVVRGVPVHLLHPPPCASLDWLPDWRDELVRLGEMLERLSGRELRPEALREALALLERQRALLRRLVRFRDMAPFALSIAEAYALVRLGSLVPRGEHCEMLDLVLAALPERRPGSDGKLRRGVRRMRAVLTGGSCAQAPLEVLEAIDAAGIDVVDDDLLRGLRRAGTPRPDGDPFTVLAESSLPARTPEPLPPGGGLAAGRALLERIHESYADGVVFLAPEACALDRRAFLLEQWALEQAGIPYLVEAWPKQSPDSAAGRERLAEFATRCLPRA